MPILARAFLLLTFVVVIVGGVVFGVASRRVDRTHDIPPPPIARATAPDEVARGGRLFRTNCLDCHAGPTAAAQHGERRPSGGRVMGAPSFMGQIWAPNLTADVDTGVGGWTDAEIARLLRNGLRRDGRYATTMPRFGRLSDADVAALIGFLRSSDPMVAAVRNDVPRPGLDVAGTLALAFAAGVDTRGAPHVAMPPRGRSAEYGRYLASAVYGCVDCHTEGFISTEEKLRAPILLAGGQFHRNPRGEPIYSTNLTPDPESGLGKGQQKDKDK
ncbi:MAG: cytochrome c, partial [Deltaproteobacteria bacterium]|nr:cytochrome c [Deltaproteobacteria bacterium]